MKLKKVCGYLGVVCVILFSILNVSCAKLQSSYDQDYLYPDQENYRS